MKNAHKILEKIPGRKILVIGDAILDTYVWGRADRISPEAPVPVVKVVKEEHKLGGAANVARNLAAAGCVPLLAGVVGRDPAGQELLRQLAAAGIGRGLLLTDARRPTPVKTRVLAQRQQLVRIDREEVRDLSPAQENQLLGRICPLAGQVSAVVISDYGKGVISRSFLRRLLPVLRPFRVPVCVDPKERNFPHYRGATVITPNRAEASFGSGVVIADAAGLRQAAGIFLKKLRLEYCLITQGADGMTLFDRRLRSCHIPAFQKEEVYDVTGAGDTVAAFLAAALAAGASMKDAARIANCAAGFVVKTVGCGVVGLKELGEALK